MDAFLDKLVQASKAHETPEQVVDVLLQRMSDADKKRLPDPFGNVHTMGDVASMERKTSWELMGARYHGKRRNVVCSVPSVLSPQLFALCVMHRYWGKKTMANGPINAGGSRVLLRHRRLLPLLPPPTDHL